MATQRFVRALENTMGLSSHNQHFWGNISAFFMQQICGIKVGADTINIEPHIPSVMNSACATYRSVYGAVSLTGKKKVTQRVLISNARKTKRCFQIEAIPSLCLRLMHHYNLP
jgi:hypothetical protein